MRAGCPSVAQLAKSWSREDHVVVPKVSDENHAASHPSRKSREGWGTLLCCRAGKIKTKPGPPARILLLWCRKSVTRITPPPTLREKAAKDGAPTFVILLAEGWATRLHRGRSSTEIFPSTSIVNM